MSIVAALVKARRCHCSYARTSTLCKLGTRRPAEADLDRQRFSLENSGFSWLCRKAMEWLSDDTTHFHYSL
jgi:hypothetical protein